MIDERGFDCELEWAYGSGGAGDQVGEIREGDGQPGGDAVDRYGEKKKCRSEDHTFTGPDDGCLEQKKKRADDAEAAGCVKGKGDPVLDLCEFGVDGQASEEALDRRLQAARCDEKNEKSDGGDGEGDVSNEAEMRSGDTTDCGDEDEDEDEDVEEFFEDDGAKRDGGRSAEVVGVGEDAHDVADAQGKDVVGSERGHENACADEEVSAEGTRTARHHLGPADATQSVAGEGETQNAEDPYRMDRAEGEDVGEGDSAEGVPEKEGADEQAGNGLKQVAAIAG